MGNIEYEEIRAYKSKITGNIYETIEELKKDEMIFVCDEVDRHTFIKENKVFIDVEEIIKINVEYGAEFVNKVLNKLVKDIT